jgi:hypothetical protein
MGMTPFLLRLLGGIEEDDDRMPLFAGAGRGPAPSPMPMPSGMSRPPMDMMHRVRDPMEHGAATPLADVPVPPEVRQAPPSMQEIPQLPNETSNVGDAAALQRQPSAFEAYREHISGMPNREDLKPSIGRKILAALIGAGEGFSGRPPVSGHRIANAPYNNAMRDWQTEGQGLEDLAGLEDRKEGRTLTAERDAAMERNRIRDDERNSAKLTADMEAARVKLEQGWARIQTIQDEGERRREADRLMAEHREGTRAILAKNAESNRIRATSYQDRTRELNEGVLHPAAQTSIRKLALRELASDPEFAPYWDNSRYQFGSEGKPVPPELVDKLYDAIEQREFEIANRKRRDYQPPAAR